MYPSKKNNNGLAYMLINNPLETNDNFSSLAEEAILYARAHIKLCATELGIPAEKAHELFRQVKGTRVAQLNPKRSLKSLFRIPDIHDHLITHQVKSIAKATKASTAGNCFEYAVLALNFLWKKGIHHAEVFKIANGDHVFVVIGRQKGSDSTKFETWGDARICDPWANIHFSASEIPRKLKCFIRADEINQIYDFNPTTDILKRGFFYEEENTQEAKQLGLGMAVSKLTLLEKTLDQLAHQFDYSLFRTLGNDIREKITELESSKKDLFEAFASNQIFQHHLSRLIFEFLELAFQIAKASPPLKEKLHEELVNNWMASWYSQDKPIHFIDRFQIIAHLIKRGDSSITLPLIQRIDRPFLRKFIWPSNTDVGTLGALFFLYRTEKEVATLLSTLDESTIASLNAASSLNEKTLAERLFKTRPDAPLLFLLLLDRLPIPAVSDAMALFEDAPGRLNKLIPHLHEMSNETNRLICLNHITYLTVKHGLIDLYSALQMCHYPAYSTKQLILLASQYTRRKISLSYKPADRSLAHPDAQYHHFEKTLSSKLQTIGSLESLFSLPDIHIKPNQYILNAMAAQVKFLSSGSVEDHVILTLHALLRLGIRRAESCYLSNTASILIVINRLKDSDLTKPETWGNAIICDPYFQCMYTIQELYTIPHFINQFNGQAIFRFFDPRYERPIRYLIHDDIEEYPTNDQALIEIKWKLMLIKEILESFTTHSTLQNTHDLCSRLDGVLSYLENSQNQLPEHLLSTIAHIYLSKALTLTESDSTVSQAFRQRLIDGWIDHWSNMDAAYMHSISQKETCFLYSIFLKWNDDVFVSSLLDKISPELLKIIFMHIPNAGFPLFHSCLLYRTKEPISKLLSKLDEETIDYLANQHILGKTLVEHLLDKREDVDVLLALLDKLLPASLKSATELITSQLGHLSSLKAGPLRQLLKSPEDSDSSTNNQSDADVIVSNTQSTSKMQSFWQTANNAGVNCDTMQNTFL